MNRFVLMVGCLYKMISLSLLNNRAFINILGEWEWYCDVLEVHKLVILELNSLYIPPLSDSLLLAWLSHYLSHWLSHLWVCVWWRVHHLCWLLQFCTRSPCGAGIPADFLKSHCTQHLCTYLALCQVGIIIFFYSSNGCWLSRNFCQLESFIL